MLVSKPLHAAVIGAPQSAWRVTCLSHFAPAGRHRSADVLAASQPGAACRPCTQR